MEIHRLITDNPRVIQPGSIQFRGRGKRGLSGRVRSWDGLQYTVGEVGNTLRTVWGVWMYLLRSV
jgi:hypothetical protein